MKERKVVKKRLVLKKSVKTFFSKVLITIIVFLLGMILVKDNKYKSYIIDNVYQKSFKFTKAKKIYEKYFGKFLSVDKIVADDKAVFSEKLSYKKDNLYKDGVMLTVSDNYMVPALESGIVIFIGDKKDYGNTIIIEQVNGIDVYYSNINPNANIKLYDYIEKGKLLGEAKNNKLYLLFQKDGKYLDYKKYI